MNVVNNDNDFVFDSPDQVVLKLEERYKCLCHLKSKYQIKLPSIDNKNLLKQNIDDVIT